MRKNQLINEHENLVYIALLFFAIILGLIGHRVFEGTIKIILLNLASGCLTTVLIFFLLNRFTVLGNYWKKGQSQKITVLLNHGKDTIELPAQLRRSEFSRAEVLGRIGMIPMKEKGKKFSLGYLNDSKFLQQINDILDNDGELNLIIPCDKDEFRQFDL